MNYRDYQQELDDSIHSEWTTGMKNVLAVSPTGTGKTVLFSGIIKKEKRASVVIAHRNSLVLQISRALNRNEVPHRLIAQPSVIREAVNLHMNETGRSYYDPSAPCGVSSLKTLISRKSSLTSWFQQIRLWVTDEAHHLTRENSWGTAIDLFKNARGLGVTATPIRSDGMGLGSKSHGVFDVLVEGRTQREMILDGWLVNYQLFAPPSDADFSGLKPTASGDYSRQKLRTVEASSHIVGDVVQHYLRLAPGKLGVTFASNLDTAREITADFNQHGVPAQIVHADTPEIERFEIERKFKKRELLQLVNVDLFGEGYDLPQLEVISLARKTDSFSLFVQQCGRVLRPSFKPGLPIDTREQRLAAIQQSHKPVGIIIDHVSNIRRHGRPRYCEHTGELFIDLCYAQWSLDATKNKPKTDDDLIPATTCSTCAGTYPGISRLCPYCGETSIPLLRTKPAHVNGDLELLTPEALAELVGLVETAQKSPVEVMQDYLHRGFGNVIAKSQAINQNRRLKILQDIGQIIDFWGGYHRSFGRQDFEIHRLFFFRFGTDILTARTLKIPEATKLLGELQDFLNEVGINDQQTINNQSNNR